MSYSAFMPRVQKPCRLTPRVSAETRALVNSMMRQWGQNEASVVERAVRDFAAREGIVIDPALDMPAPPAQDRPADGRTADGAG